MLLNKWIHTYYEEHFSYNWLTLLIICEKPFYLTFSISHEIFLFLSLHIFYYQSLVSWYILLPMILDLLETHSSSMNRSENRRTFDETSTNGENKLYSTILSLAFVDLIERLQSIYIRAFLTIESQWLATRKDSIHFEYRISYCSSHSTLLWFDKRNADFFKNTVWFYAIKHHASFVDGKQEKMKYCAVFKMWNYIAFRLLSNWLMFFSLFSFHFCCSIKSNICVELAFKMLFNIKYHTSNWK